MEKIVAHKSILMSNNSNWTSVKVQTSFKLALLNPSKFQQKIKRKCRKISITTKDS